MTIDPDRLVASVRTLHSLPESWQRISEVVDLPSSSAADIAQALGGDQAMVVRVLRLANSSFYGYPARVEDITQAVTIIGTRQIRELALATVAVDVFAGFAPHFLDMAAFWRHAFATGCCARQLALRCQEPNTERHFVAGLLSSVGRLILFKSHREEAVAALQHNRLGMNLPEAERTVFGCDHTEIAWRLLERWKLPRSLIDAVHYQHGQFQLARDPLDPTLVHLALVLVTAIDLGSNGDSLVPIIDPTVWNLVHLPAECLEPLLVEVTRQTDELVEILGQIQKKEVS